MAGGTIPANLWLAYMQVVTEGWEVLEFPDRSDPVTPTGTPTPETVELPDVTGQDAIAAQAALEAEGFVVTLVEEPSDTIPVGAVIRSEPGAGEVEKGSTVMLVVSSGPVEPTEEETTEEPDPEPSTEEPTNPTIPTVEPTLDPDVPTPGPTDENADADGAGVANNADDAVVSVPGSNDDGGA